MRQNRHFKPKAYRIGTRVTSAHIAYLKGYMLGDVFIPNKFISPAGLNSLVAQYVKSEHSNGRTLKECMDIILKTYAKQFKRNIEVPYTKLIRTFTEDQLRVTV